MQTQARWDALKDAVGELAGAAGDPDGFPAAFAAFRQIGQGLDMEEVVNALHVPDDAGEHAEALRRMLLRIPNGWGRWIGCSRGWYPILVELDEQLASLLPGYELHQVKEKYGGLRFYWDPGERVTDPDDHEGAAHLAALDRRTELAEQLVEAAEGRASATCELCGQRGQPCCTPGPYPWYQTLCPDCAQQRGYVPAS